MSGQVDTGQRRSLPGPSCFFFFLLSSFPFPGPLLGGGGVISCLPGPSGQRVRLVLVPTFVHRPMLVLVNLHTLEARVVTFSAWAPTDV